MPTTSGPERAGYGGRVTSPPPDARSPRPALETARVGQAVEAAARAAGVEAGRVELREATVSTSSDLVDAVTRDPSRWPDRSVLVADHQHGGRGRNGRRWSTPPRAALTVSYLLRPQVGPDRLGWLPLLAGLAVVQALAEVCGLRGAVKWPNDVLLDAPDGAELAGWGRRRKVAGVLAEVVPLPSGSAGGLATGPPAPSTARAAVVLGVGVNVSQTADELPVPSATSLALVGAPVDRTALLGAVTTRLLTLDERWRAGAGDARASGLDDECAAVSATLGEPVLVDLPGGRTLRGTARGLAPDGGLVVADPTGRERTVLAGDVRLRSLPGAVN